MVIKSPFKDYYDFVANQYGGGDPTMCAAPSVPLCTPLVAFCSSSLTCGPTIVYVRGRISPLDRDPNFGGVHETHLTVEIDGDCPLTAPDYFNMRNQELRQKYLIIAGKAYIIQKKAGFFEEDVNS
jgi:hypothetical protein